MVTLSDPNQGDNSRSQRGVVSSHSGDNNLLEASSITSTTATLQVIRHFMIFVLQNHIINIVSIIIYFYIYDIAVAIIILWILFFLWSCSHLTEFCSNVILLLLYFYISCLYIFLSLKTLTGSSGTWNPELCKKSATKFYFKKNPKSFNPPLTLHLKLWSISFMTTDTKNTLTTMFPSDVLSNS